MKKLSRKLIAGTAMVAAAAAVAACGKGPATTVYGPPEYFSQEEVTEFDTTDELNEAVYGPPADETFDPADEINEDVYGPPEVFD